MGIGLCKYLNRFSMMPYFHSAINVFKWLLLSSGLDVGGEIDLLKIGWGGGCLIKAPLPPPTTSHQCSLPFVTSDEGSETRYSASSLQLQPTVQRWVSALPPLPSRGQQRAGGLNRRLPLSDYNLWSISVIGGVCRDSYSNNYLD